MYDVCTVDINIFLNESCVLRCEKKRLFVFWLSAVVIHSLVGVGQENESKVMPSPPGVFWSVASMPCSNAKHGF